MIESLSPTKESLAEVARLEAALFSDPWSEASLASHLASPFGLGIVIRKNGRIASYGLFQQMGDEGEVLRIGTAPAFARQGLATEILRAFASRGVKRTFLEVRKENERAKKLYEKEGFVLIGVRKGYYKDPADDALIYQKTQNGEAT